MLEEQESSFTNPQTSDSMWISEEIFPPGGANNLAEVVQKAVGDLSMKPTEIPQVTAKPMQGEWIGNRVSNPKTDQRSALSNGDAYVRMEDESITDVVFIYLHGGQFL